MNCSAACSSPSRRKVEKRLPIRVVLALAAPVLAFVFLASRSPTIRILDEAIMDEGRRFRVKLARQYENLPFHYTGEVILV